MPNGKQSNRPANSNRRNNNTRRTNVPNKPKSAAKAPGQQKTRTPGTIINALAAQTQRLTLDPYECCRLMGLVPKMAPSIPDGANGKHICVCLYSIDRVSFPTGVTGSQTVDLQFNPWYPTSGAAYSSTKFNLNGRDYLPSAGLVAPIGVVAQIASLSAGDTYPGNITNALDIYAATGYRIVSQAHHIQYTGPVTSCSGMVRGFTNSWALAPRGETIFANGTPTTPGPGYYGTVYDSSAVQRGTVNVNTPILQVDGTRTITSYPSNTVSLRPEQGCLIRLNHRGTSFKTQPVQTPNPYLVSFPSLAAPSANTPTELESIFQAPPAPSPGYCGGIAAFDNDWEGAHVTLESVNADASFSITSCVCVEFQPQSSSNFYPLAKETTQPQPQRINKVNSILASQGVVTPLNVSGPR